MAEDDADWRLIHLRTQPYLQGVQFQRKTYHEFRPGWDHDHCVACWATLAEPGYAGADVLHEGYATTGEFIRGEDYEWVCIPCFEAFASAMSWIDVTPADGAL